MRRDEFDPVSYIEHAFLDLEAEEPEEEEGAPEAGDGEPVQAAPREAPQPREPGRHLVDAIRKAQAADVATPTKRLKTTSMRAPRPRRRKSPAPKTVIRPEVEQLWTQIPKNLKFLASLYDDRITRKYYSTEPKESREELIQRLVDPQLNLEDTARLLGVCPATVRRYTNRGWLPHHRTPGNQRRFRLSGVVRFVEEYGRNPE